MDLGDFKWDPAAFAQLLTNLAGVVALFNAPLAAAVGVQGLVLEGGHQASRVTRTTSSTVVTPSTANRLPASRMLIPWRRANRSSCCSLAPS